MQYIYERTKTDYSWEIENFCFLLSTIMSPLVMRYGDGAGNTTEENSSVFSLI